MARGRRHAGGGDDTGLISRHEVTDRYGEDGQCQRVSAGPMLTGSLSKWLLPVTPDNETITLLVNVKSYMSFVRALQRGCLSVDAHTLANVD